MSNVIHDYIATHYQQLPPQWISRLENMAEGHENAVDNLVNLIFPSADKITRGMRSFAALIVNDPKHVAYCKLAETLSRAKFNIDKLIQMPTLFSAHPTLDMAFSLRVKDITLLRHYYNDNRIFTLLSAGAKEKGELRDTMDMIERIRDRKPDLRFLPKKPKHLTALHDSAVRALPKINQDDFDLRQREDILMLDNLVLDGNLVIRVPKTHYDMIDLGEALSFCIGNGSYSRKVANRKSSVVALFEEGKARYGIEFSRYHITEAQGFGNRRENRPSEQILNALKALVLKKPDLPTDFLPITDSGWVHGYRYDNKNLYLLLKETVYVYFDVPEDVYDELLDSERKGTFVNQIIKPEYNCEKVGHIDDINLQKS